MSKLVCTSIVFLLLLFSNSNSQEYHVTTVKYASETNSEKYIQASNNVVTIDPYSGYYKNCTFYEFPLVVSQTGLCSIFEIAQKGNSKNKSTTLIQYQLLGAAGKLNKISMNQYQNSLIEVRKRISLKKLRIQSKAFELKYFNKKQLGG